MINTKLDSVCNDGKTLHILPLEQLTTIELAKVYLYVLSEYGDGPRVAEVEDALSSINLREELYAMEIENDILQTKIDDALEDRDHYKEELENCIEEKDN